MRAAKHLGQPSEAASVIAFLCSHGASFMTGEVLHHRGVSNPISLQRRSPGPVARQSSAQACRSSGNTCTPARTAHHGSGHRNQ